jgi:hypothetical protein
MSGTKPCVWNEMDSQREGVYKLVHFLVDYPPDSRIQTKVLQVISWVWSRFRYVMKLQDVFFHSCEERDVFFPRGIHICFGIIDFSWNSVPTRWPMSPIPHDTLAKYEWQFDVDREPLWLSACLLLQLWINGCQYDSLKTIFHTKLIYGTETILTDKTLIF